MQHFSTTQSRSAPSPAGEIQTSRRIIYRRLQVHEPCFCMTSRNLMMTFEDGRRRTYRGGQAECCKGK